MSGGTVNVARSIWGDEAFKPETFSEREAFVWLIMEAAWKPRTRRVGNAVVSLERGQCAASVRYMADTWKWSKSRVARYLARLRDFGMIENRDSSGTASGTGVSVITICKYEEYQNAPGGSGTPRKPKAGQKRDSSGTKQNKGEIREEDKRERARPRVPPADWSPTPDQIAYAEALGLSSQQIHSEAESFRDWHQDNRKTRSPAYNFAAAWRTWAKRAADRNGGQHELTRRSPTRPAEPDPFASAGDMFASRGVDRPDDTGGPVLDLTPGRGDVVSLFPAERDAGSAEDSGRAVGQGAGPVSAVCPGGSLFGMGAVGGEETDASGNWEAGPATYGPGPGGYAR